MAQRSRLTTGATRRGPRVRPRGRTVDAELFEAVAAAVKVLEAVDVEHADRVGRSVARARWGGLRLAW